MQGLMKVWVACECLGRACGGRRPFDSRARPVPSVDVYGQSRLLTKDAKPHARAVNHDASACCGNACMQPQARTHLHARSCVRPLPRPNARDALCCIQVHRAPPAMRPVHSPNGSLVRGLVHRAAFLGRGQTPGFAARGTPSSRRHVAGRRPPAAAPRAARAARCLHRRLLGSCSAPGARGLLLGCRAAAPRLSCPGGGAAAPRLSCRRGQS